MTEGSKDTLITLDGWITTSPFGIELAIDAIGAWLGIWSCMVMGRGCLYLDDS